jgi:methylmalonyl-CoA mutase N-terminal domain/subunit
MIPAIEQGFPQREIQDAAYRAQLDVEKGEAVVVGVNRFTEDETATPEVLRVDPALERAQVERTRAWRAARASDALAHHQRVLTDAARGDTPLGGPIYDAVRAGLTVGEICDALRGVFGRYTEPVFL